jgi:quercetin dioxygenase-like cupin family protein
MVTSVEPHSGHVVQIGGFGTIFKIRGADTDGRFAVVEHTLAPRVLAAPLHRHANEDEYSLVLEGTLGAQLGDDVVTAEPGTYVFKPRGQWHTFWNAGDTPARIVEMLSPGGFETYFEEIGEVFASTGPDPVKLSEIAGRYSIEMDLSSLQRLVQEHGLTL